MRFRSNHKNPNIGTVINAPGTATLPTGRRQFTIPIQSVRARRNGAPDAFFAVILWAAVFIPGHMFGGFVDRGFALLIGLTSVVVIWRHGMPQRIGGLPTRSVASTFFFITFIYALSYLVLQLSSPFDSGWRDYFELVRYPIYLGALILIVSGRTDRGRRTLEVAIAWSLWWSFGAAIAFITDLPLISPLFRDVLYAGTKNNIAPGIGIYRLAAPFENPNYLAFYLTLILAYLLFFSVSKRRLVLLLLDVILLVLTGSRSGIAGALVVLAFFLVHSVWRFVASRDTRPMVWVAMLASSGGLILSLSGASIWDSSRLSATADAIREGAILDDASVEARLTSDIEALNNFMNSPVIGAATKKYSGQDGLDNQFVKWILRLGLIGSIPLALVIFRMFMFQLRSKQRQGLSLGVLALWTSMLLLLQTGAFLESFRLFFIFWTVVSVTTVAHREHEAPVLAS